MQLLVAPKFDDINAKQEEEVVSLQTAMELDDDTLMFLKIVVSTCQIFLNSPASWLTAIPQVMFADVAAVHLDLEKDYGKQDTSAVVSYVTEV